MLIDTHILIWTLEGKAGRMGPNTVERMQSVDMSKVCVSAASFFEITLKQRRGGLKQLDVATILGELHDRAVTVFPITGEEMAAVPDLEATPHADPFDLLLIAQAIAQNVPLLTCDEKILEVALPGLRLIDGRK